MTYPLVYIIVLNYKRKDDTLACLGSLYLMDYPSFKVIMVDNGSDDGTPDAVRKAFPQAEVVENRENLMYAEGNNAGIRLALKEGAELVLILNNDTVADPGLLSEMVAAIRSYPGAGVAGPMIYYYPPRPGGEVIWYAGGVVELWKGLTAHRGIREVDTGRYARVEETGYVTGCAMLVSRDCLDKAGLLDPSYIIYSEDADLSLRAKKAGFRLIFVPGGKLWHKVSLTSGGEFSPFKIKHKIRSNFLLFRRYAKPWHWLTIPFFVAWRALRFTLRAKSA